MPRLPNGIFAESHAEYADRLLKTIIARDVQIRKMERSNETVRATIAKLRSAMARSRRASQHKDYIMAYQCEEAVSREVLGLRAQVVALEDLLERQNALTELLQKRIAVMESDFDADELLALLEGEN